MIDPKKIFEQADCFYQALAVLCNAGPENTQLGVMLGEPAMVVGAFTVELFLKCLACIETSKVPHGHHLRQLYDGLSDSTRQRIDRGWNDEILAHRGREWDGLEAAMGQKISRDLPSALTAASRSFELIRYSYEGRTHELEYFLQDLPQLLGRVIVELKPEWKGHHRPHQPLPAPGR